MVRKTLGRAGVALAAGAAVFATAVPANAASYSAFAFSRSDSQPTIYDLIALENRGVTVRVVLDGAHQSANQSASNALTSAGVGVVWSSSTFAYTHQKTITVDGTKSLILTGNLTSQYYRTGRDYGVFDDDSRDVAAIEKVFAADHDHTTVAPTDGDHLLWSPTDSRNRLLSLINSATTTLDIEELEFSDSTVANAVVARAKAGVAVRVVLESPGSYSSQVSAVEAAGGTVVGYSDPDGFYIHAKTMVADHGLSTQEVEAGSMNISSNSLANNRELGIILTGTRVAQAVATTVENTFDSDYAGGTAA